jgi:hypothetical protein
MTENEKRSAAEVLRAARANVEKWWVQSILVGTTYIPRKLVEERRAAGDTIITQRDFAHYAIRSTCAIGALSLAENLVDAMGRHTYPHPDDPIVILLDAALPKDVHRRLRIPKGEWTDPAVYDAQQRIIEFNDHGATTKRMVLNLFDRAIKLAEDPEYAG